MSTQKAKAQTVTLTLHRDRCDPSKWTVKEWKLFADFVHSGELSLAASLSRLGLQLVLDDRHQPTGGNLEHAGWSDDSDGVAANELDQLDLDHAEPCEVYRVYRGPTEYAVQYAVGDGDVTEGYETEVFATLVEAKSFAKILTRELYPESN